MGYWLWAIGFIAYILSPIACFSLLAIGFFAHCLLPIACFSAIGYWYPRLLPIAHSALARPIAHRPNDLIAGD